MGFYAHQLYPKLYDELLKDGFKKEHLDKVRIWIDKPSGVSEGVEGFYSKIYDTIFVNPENVNKNLKPILAHEISHLKTYKPLRNLAIVGSLLSAGLGGYKFLKSYKENDYNKRIDKKTKAIMLAGGGIISSNILRHIAGEIKAYSTGLKYDEPKRIFGPGTLNKIRYIGEGSILSSIGNIGKHIPYLLLMLAPYMIGKTLKENYEKSKNNMKTAVDIKTFMKGIFERVKGLKDVGTTSKSSGLGF